MKKRINKYNAAKEAGKRSMLEVTCENMLKEANIEYLYEPFSFNLRPAFTFCYYDGVKGELKHKCIGRPMTYKTDFIDPDNRWLIEVKGIADQAFQMRFKLFRAYCVEHLPNIKLFICHNKKEIALAIDIIKSL